MLRILNEPTAAALAYGPQGKPQERVAVYDLGGGTFDVTVLDLAGNVFEVLATAGDTALGGDDIDVVVAERMADDLLVKHRFDARTDPAAFGRLRILAEQMKRELSTHDEHVAAVDDLVPGARGSRVLWTFRMTRPELEWASLALIERTFKVCHQALDVAGAEPTELDRIILVGGATRMPMVARKVEQFFGRPPIVRINPDEVVALGAAIQAALLDRTRRRTEPDGSCPATEGSADVLAAARPLPGRGQYMMEHPRIAEDSVVRPLPEEDAPQPTPHRSSAPPDRSSEIPPGLPVVRQRASSSPPSPRAVPVAQIALTRAPFVSSARPAKPLVFDVPERKPATQFDGELPVPPPQTPRSARPASSAPPARPRSADADNAQRARDAAAPSPPRPAPLLIDVTPLSLGVETAGGFCDVLIEANTPVPCDRSRTFATASDGQTTVRVRVAQGPSKRFEENTFLGEVELSGIPPAVRGETRIAVTFVIDQDGILDVRARDVKTGRETLVRLQMVGAQHGAGEAGEIEALRARHAAHAAAPIEARR